MVSIIFRDSTIVSMLLDMLSTVKDLECLYAEKYKT